MSSRFARHFSTRAARNSRPSANPTSMGTALPIWRCIYAHTVRTRLRYKFVHEIDAHCYDIIIDGEEFKVIRKSLGSCKLSDSHNSFALMCCELASQIDISTSPTHVRVEDTALFRCGVHVRNCRRKPAVLIESPI
jgi:hypothetical protein